MQHTCETLGDLRHPSGLQMSAILMNTPKIKFLGIRFLRVALKNQHNLAGVLLQETKDRSPDSWTRKDLSHLEWDMLFLGNTSS